VSSRRSAHISCVAANLFRFFSGPASIVYDEGGNKELEDDKDSQDEIVLPSRYPSRAPSMAPSRTHSASDTPQTFLSPVDDHSAVGTQMSRSHSTTSQAHGDRHPDGYADSSVSKKSKSSSSRSHPKASSQSSPNPSTVSHHTSRAERSQPSPRSSLHHSHHSTPPREPSPPEVSHPVSHPVSRESSQLSHQSSHTTPTSTGHHRDREIPRSGNPIPNYYAGTPTSSHPSQSKQPTPSSSVLNDDAPGISRAQSRLRSVVVPTQAPDQTGVKFPSVSQTDSPYETPVPRSAIAIDSRTTSLTPSDSASNIHINYADGTATIPGTVAGSVLGSVLPEPSVGRKSKRDKNRSVLSTITSASYSTTKPSTEELQQPPAPTPPVPQISIPGSPSISSSIGGSRLTTNPSTPAVARSLKSSLTSSLSYATNHPEPPPPQLPAMSRQNSDTGSVIAGGFGSALGGVLTGVWGSYKSATPSPVVENPPPGPATTGFESTLETIHDVEVPGGFGGEREEASVSSRELIPEPTIIPPSPPKLEELRVPTPKAEVADVPAYETETVPETPVEPEPSILSAADRKRAKKQREKEKKDKEAQEKKEREERERLEQEERDRQEREERERKKAEKEAKKREREEREREQREQEERAERERIEREARERAEWEAREQAKREAREQAEREAREQAEREAREQAEREARKREKEAKDRAEREAREAKEQAEREAREQAEKAAMEKMDKVTRRRAEREAAKRAEQEAKERAEREAIERAEREAKERAEEAARAKAERIAKRKAEREAREQAEREAKEKADQEAREKAEREAKERAERQEREKRKREEERAERERIENERVEKERIEKERIEKARIERERIENERIENERIEKERVERERVERERVEKEEREKAEREAKEKADREAKEREEAEKAKTLASKIPSARGSTVGKNDRSRKTSALSQKEQKNEWAGAWDSNSTEKEGSSGLPPILTSSGLGGVFDGAGDFWSTGKKDSPGGAEELELRTPLTKKKGKGADSLSNLPKVATATEPANVGKLDPLEDLNMNNVSARVSVSSRSENERWTDAEQGPSPTEPNPPTFAPELSSEASLSIPPELLMAPKEVKDEASTTPKPWPAPSLPSSRQSQVLPPAPAPTKAEPEKPLSLWERKKLKMASPPAPASSLFGGGDGTNSSGVWGDGSGGGGNTESIAMPTLVGDRQSVFTDTARDQKRENQRENVVEGLLGSNSARRRNDSAQSQLPAKPTPKPAPAPAPAPQKSSGWGSWGSSLLNTVASAVAAPDRSPSPEPPPVKPKIEDPPRGFTPSQPPKSQPAGFGSLKQPGWGGPGGSGDNSAWGAAKPGPTPITQKPSTGPVWGAKPAGSSFGSTGTGWGSGTGQTFGSNVGKNLSVDTAAKPLESGPNTAGPENIPESAVEIKHVPAPGGFGSAITDKKEEAGDAQDDAWGWEEASGNKGSKKTSKLPSPPQEKAPEPPTEVTEEPAKTEEAATPAEEDEFDWTNQTKKKKKGQAASVAQSQTTSAQNTPDPENADDGAGGGGGGGRKKKKGKGKK
jgi:hypothetical protein